MVDSATRNRSSAAPGLILFGAMIVTFLPVDTMRGSRMKLRQVKPITHVIRSLSSVSGLKLTDTGWVVFFALCAAAAIPGLLILWILIKRGNFEDIEKKERTEAAES